MDCDASDQRGGATLLVVLPGSFGLRRVEDTDASPVIIKHGQEVQKCGEGTENESGWIVSKKWT